MQKRTWTSQEKLRIVLEGLSGQIEITKLCSKYQIAQTQYYRWRDQLLQFGYQAFETKNITRKEQSLEHENLRLRRIIGNLTVVLDWFTKEIVGYSISLQSKTQDWLNALDMALNNRFPSGIRESAGKQPVFLISDNGCQPTSQRFMMSCSILGIKQIFTTWSNPKGNSDTERVIRTIKEDIVWPYDWDNPFVFEAALAKWIHSYNSDFPHQALNNLTPRQFYEKYVYENIKFNPPKADLSDKAVMAGFPALADQPD